MEKVKNFLEKNSNKILKIFWIFWIFLVLFFLFQNFFLDQKKLEKNIEISSNWYNISEKKYLNEKEFFYTDWDIIQRNIFLKNNWIFTVNNFALEDYNIFSDKFIWFTEDIKWWELTVLQYKTIVDFDKNITEDKNLEKNFLLTEKILTRAKKFEKNFDVEIKDEKKNNLFENIFEITWIWKKTINNDFNEYLEVFWKNLNWISNILIKCDWKVEIFEIAKRDLNEKMEDRISIFIKNNSLEKWACQIWTEISWIWIFSNFFINIKKNNNRSDINLKFITPDKVVSEAWWIVVLQWKWFNKLVAIQIDNWVILDLEFLEIVSDNVVIVNIPKKMKTWEYFFRFLSEDWVYENRDLKIFVE